MRARTTVLLISAVLAAGTSGSSTSDSGKTDKAASRGRDQRTSIASFPGDRAKLVDLTDRRFISPNRPEGFGAATAEKILDVVRKHIRPTP